MNFSQSSTTSQIRIYEVGPRDGLQNEAKFVPTDVKVELIRKLAEAGLKDIESARYGLNTSLCYILQLVPTMLRHDGDLILCPCKAG